MEHVHAGTGREVSVSMDLHLIGTSTLDMCLCSIIINNNMNMFQNNAKSGALTSRPGDRRRGVDEEVRRAARGLDERQRGAIISASGQLDPAAVYSSCKQDSPPHWPVQGSCAAAGVAHHA